LFANLNLDSSDEDGQDLVNAPLQGVASFVPLLETPDSAVNPSPEEAGPELGMTERKKKSKRTRHPQSRKASKWADQCMYAELLEMNDDEPWSSPDGCHGLPENLESGWIAVAPVPAGKRCLAITYQSSGSAGLGMCVFSLL
jgi:snurportin-1